MPHIFFSIIVFVFGLIVGSFLNCVIYRLEHGSSFLRGRSFCPYCKHVLSWLDLIPVISFLILKGKCRYCQKPISVQYPLVELATAAIFLFIFFLPNIYPIGQFISMLFYLVISSFLIIIFVYDLKHYLIPDKIIYSAIAVTCLYQLFRIWNFANWDLFRISDLGFGILPALFLLAIIVISRGHWMGLGDFKLAILMGLLLGWPEIVVALFSAFLIGAIIGAGLIIAGKKTLKSEVPFGPFLVSGTFLAMFWGKQIVDWYSSLFLI